MIKINKSFSTVPRIYDYNIKINLTINPETIPILIPEKRLKAIQKVNTPQGKIQDPSPFYITEEIEDINQPANGVIFSREFWESYLKVLEERPIPGRKKGHLAPYSYETPENDFYTIGGKFENDKIFLRIYIPPYGFETSNDGFIRDNEAGLVHFSVVSWTEDLIERDENGYVKSIKAIRSVKGERNDAVEIGMGAMDMAIKTNKNFDGILKVLKKDEFELKELSPYYNISELYNEEEGGIKLNPYPNEHAARVRQPGDFQKGSFRRINIKKGIDAIIGRLKGKTTMSTQAYRFDAKIYTAAQAKKWLKDHNIKYISFEAATGGKSERQEVYIMSDSVYSDIVKNLNNQIDNGAVNRNKIASDLGITPISDEHIEALKTLKQITDIIGAEPVKAIQEMKINAEKVKQQSYNNTREKLMTEAFGPEKLNQAGEEKPNLKRQAADAYVKTEIQPEEELKKEIEAAKTNPVVCKFSFEEADINSETNLLTKINGGKTKYRTSEFVKI